MAMVNKHLNQMMNHDLIIWRILHTSLCRKIPMKISKNINGVEVMDTIEDKEEKERI